MSKFNLSSFIENLLNNKQAQNSLATILSNLKLFNVNAKNTASESENAKTSERPKQNTPLKTNYPEYFAYAEMIKRHDEISKQIDARIDVDSNKGEN